MALVVPSSSSRLLRHTRFDEFNDRDVCLDADSANSGSVTVTILTDGPEVDKTVATGLIGGFNDCTFVLDSNESGPIVGFILSGLDK